jgi:hypothetical protein
MEGGNMPGNWCAASFFFWLALLTSCFADSVAFGTESKLQMVPLLEFETALADGLYSSEESSCGDESDGIGHNVPEVLLRRALSLVNIHYLVAVAESGSEARVYSGWARLVPRSRIHIYHTSTQNLTEATIRAVSNWLAAVDLTQKRVLTSKSGSSGSEDCKPHHREWLLLVGQNVWVNTDKVAQYVKRLSRTPAWLPVSFGSFNTSIFASNPPIITDGVLFNTKALAEAVAVYRERAFSDNNNKMTEVIVSSTVFIHTNDFFETATLHKPIRLPHSALVHCHDENVKDALVRLQLEVESGVSFLPSLSLLKPEQGMTLFSPILVVQIGKSDFTIFGRKMENEKGTSPQKTLRLCLIVVRELRRSHNSTQVYRKCFSRPETLHLLEIGPLYPEADHLVQNSTPMYLVGFYALMNDTPQVDVVGTPRIIEFTRSVVPVTPFPSKLTVPPSSTGAHTGPRFMNIIIFSKDRASQVGQCAFPAKMKIQPQQPHHLPSIFVVQAPTQNLNISHYANIEIRFF